MSSAYVGRLRRQGLARRRSGAVLLGTGLAEVVAGTVLTVVGNIKRREAQDMEDEWLEETGDNDKYRAENDKAKAMQYGGGILLLLGVPSTVAGIVLVAVGNGKLRRADSMAPTAGLSPTRGGGVLTLSGRF